ncbi:MAG: NmrA family NAD(P)-binding protein, partial [Gammaproteobacteria bacterium]|nr:NmrA family NAD(P)-binding protein [Gammaproteobacteria bacterium]
MHLIVGATGFVGGMAARQLRERGFEVRALVRGSAGHQGAAALVKAGVTVVAGDLEDGAAVA